MKKFGLVALAGRPNAGKSTFLNRVVGEKIAIVSDRPQTTRNRILGITMQGETQIGFLDLPGIHKPAHKLNSRMMGMVHQGVEEADVVIHFADATQPIGKGDRFVAELLKEKNIPVILALNKIDLINKNRMIGILDAWFQAFQPQELVPISCLEGTNIDRLMELLSSMLPEQPWRFGEDELTDQSIRFIAQELIREKIVRYTDEEVPHATAVTITQFNEGNEEEPWFIEATIWVEKKTQRMILLGANGSMISKIRTGAKRNLKQFLGRAGELELLVKVREHWREDKAFLESL